jgi:hypothetical protein
MPILGIIASSYLQSTDPGAFVPIATTTLASTTSTVSFTGIPSTYTHLQIRGRIATSDNNQRSLLMYPNNDQSAIYAAHSVFGDGATAYAKNNVSTQWNVLLSDGLFGVAGPADFWTSFVIDVLDYANTNKYKTTRALMGFDANGSGTVGLGSGLWQSTTAISSLYFINTFASPFRAGSTFTLYGIKG